MQLIHCYAAADQTAGERSQAIDAASRVFQKHFGQEYALFYEPLTAQIAAEPAAGRLYIMVGTPGEGLPVEKRAAVAADLRSAIPLPQDILFQAYPLDAVAENGQYLADL